MCRQSCGQHMAAALVLLATARSVRRLGDDSGSARSELSPDSGNGRRACAHAPVIGARMVTLGLHGEGLSESQARPLVPARARGSRERSGLDSSAQPTSTRALAVNPQGPTAIGWPSPRDLRSGRVSVRRRRAIARFATGAPPDRVALRGGRAGAMSEARRTGRLAAAVGAVDVLRRASENVTLSGVIRFND
jgi:hypothetical protein